MKYEWMKKTAGYEDLARFLAIFFEKRNFVVDIIPAAGKSNVTQIVALPTEKTELRQPIKVEFQVNIDSTVVDFLPTDRTEGAIRLGILSQFLLGGALLRRETKTKEKLDLLENDFWSYIQEFFAALDS